MPRPVTENKHAKTNENHEYRFGDNGPKYLIRGPGCDMGVVILQPGAVIPNHRHNTACEVFIP